MNGIDVSNWQHGIDVTRVPCDFVIAKATQGQTYVSPDCDRVIQQCISNGKPWGVYHYIDGSGVAEIDYFINNCKGYIGQGILCLDWERVQNRAWRNESYLDQCVKRVIELTGIPPIVYASYADFPWGVCSSNNCGTWVAQYPDMERHTGYDDTPWNEGAYNCTIRQYSSTTVLDGWGEMLDVDKAYITPVQWGKYANPNNAAHESYDVDSTALAVIRGEYGNGADRRAALGSHYDTVQARVNELLDKANKVINGDYGNGSARRRNLGNDYDVVQATVNQLLQ